MPGARTPVCVRIAAAPTGEAMQRLARWLREQGMQTDAPAPSADAAPRAWRVFVAPLADAAAARARVAQLRAAGVEDLIAINDGALANGISLGVFTRRSGAERRQRELAAAGVVTDIAPHDSAGDSRRTDVVARGPFDAESFTRTFPDLAYSIDGCS
jgi:cell division septation protein DedD